MENEKSILSEGEKFKEMVPSCNLSANEMVDRKAFLTSKYSMFRKVKNVIELPTGYDFVFQEAKEFSNEILEFINFERGCCSNFSFALEFEPFEKATHLKIYGSAAIKAELKKGFTELGVLKSDYNNMDTIQKTKNAAKKLGWLGLAICGICCSLPFIAAIVGIGSVTAFAMYAERIGIAVLGLAAVFFAFYYYQKKQAEKKADCGNSCATDCGCNPATNQN